MKTCVILNPAAGSAKEIDTIVEQLRRLPRAKIETTARPGDALRLTKRLVRQGYRYVIAAGGDGTLNEVVNGIGRRAPDIQLGLLPLGTGNDFARTINLPASVSDNIKILRAQKTRLVDLVRVKSDRVRYVINVSAGGFSGLVNEKLTPEIKRNWGPLAYVRSAAAALPDLHGYKTTVILDGRERIVKDLYNVIIANGRYVAGGLPVAPEADPSDGLLDVILISKSSTPEMVLLAAQMLMGKHTSNETVICRRAAKVAIQSRPGMWFNADGEIIGNQPAVYRIMPRALHFVVGKK